MIETKPPDERVRRLLDELQFQYEFDESGGFEVQFQIGEDRSHSVYIDSFTSELDSVEIREVWAMGGKWDSALSKETANYLLIYNANVDIGAWRLTRLDDDSCIASFVAPIAAETSARTLLTVMRAVARAGDEVEDTLTGEDLL